MLALRLLLRCHLCSCQADGSSAVAHFVCVCLKIDVAGFVFMMFGAGDTRHICYCPDNNQDNLLMPHFIGVHGPVNRGGRGDTGIME